MSATPLFLKINNANTYNLEISIGAKAKVVKNLKSLEQIRNVIKREVSELILRYANHRKNALAHHHLLDSQRARCIERIQQRFSNYPTWHAHNLKAKILGATADMYAILPPTSSRFYKNQSKLINDLVALAQNYHGAEFTEA